ncbi:MAG TPA: hypothetical protein DIV79_13120 [Opitutae bacterium]|nr:hypothetical protein [Opitutaceae bacterium]HCR30947.1 hypothetical protein [Opitutae bacterium]|tara:strand:- start:169 stop:1164 length:996 start_codon:yes stop_codon:yes gene_type:complete
MSRETCTIAAFYKFVPLPDFQDRKKPLLEFCEAQGVKGTILLAEEGINSTIAGPSDGMANVLEFIQSDPAIGKLTVKYSEAPEIPFYRMKVRLKKEIVRLGRPDVNPNEKVGEYVDPDDWNELISDPNVTLIDTRNDYEFDLGTFQGAANPNTKNFREFPEYVDTELSDKKDQPIAMFCTGGIRCEKSTSLLLKKGFTQVYHLNGGILNYLEKVDPAESLWQGDCFVFDNRVTVNHQLDPGEFDMCHACRHAISEEDKASPKYEEGVTCPHCFDSLTNDQRQRAQQRQKQVEISQRLHRKHIGMTAEERRAWREEKLDKRRRKSPADGSTG